MTDRKYKPYSICMNPKFSSDGFKAYVLEQLSLYTDNIHTSDYQSYIDQSKLYPNMTDITSGMLYQLKIQKPKLLICVCMYNQKVQALEETLKGIYKNIPSLKQKLQISTDDFGVIVMQDGILKCHQSIIKFYQKLDKQSNNTFCALRQRIQVVKEEIQTGYKYSYKEKISQNNNFPQTVPKKLSLLYQNKWKPSQSLMRNQAASNENLNDSKYRQSGAQSLNLFSCFKHLNGTKLSSHAWFFEGFCRYLNPQFCVLLDVGTVPDADGITNLIKGLKSNQNIGGVSGFMGVDTELNFQVSNTPKIPEESRVNNPRNEQNESPDKLSEAAENISLSRIIDQKQQQQEQQEKSAIVKCLTRWFFSVQKAQEVQYIYAHFLDKNAQSFTKFLHVLPGAWSGYRLSALQTGQKFQKDLLQEKYFKTIIEDSKQKQKSQSDYKFANMYLAEDRILSLGIYCQKQKENGYYLKYIPNAKAKTDSMDTHYNLVVQRRRWINSSYFAFNYVFQNYEFDFENSKHGRWDYFLLKINMFLASCSFFNAYFIPCFYLFVLYSTIRNNGWIKNDDVNNYLALLLSLVYVATVLVCIGGSLNGVDWIKQIYDRDENGRIKTRSNGQKKKFAKQKNGPAIYISIIMALFTYLLLFTVSSIIVQVVYNGIMNFSTISTSSLLVLIIVGINIGTFLIILLMHLFTHPVQVCKLILGYPSYIAYQGVYTHTMVIYSFCNVDDVSWGTKGASKSLQKEQDFKRDKISFLASWILWNSLFCFILFFIDFVVPSIGKQYILIILALYSSFTTTLKAILAFVNHIKFYLCCCCS